MFACTAPAFRIGDLVEFGRPNGEKTEGKVVRVNAASITIEQTEQRGVSRIREAGAKWRVHPSLVKHVGASAAPAAPVAPKAARSEADLIAALRRIENALSPENLFCDGERPRTEARRIEARLMAERIAVVAELGREPSPRELWGF
jgi:hypothetical protein